MDVTSEYFSAKKTNANKQFKHFTGADENCEAFNNKNMWDLDQANSFSGFKKGNNAGDFNNSSGRTLTAGTGAQDTLDSYSHPIGNPAAAITTGGGCQDGTHCPTGQTCRGGECVPLLGERRGGGDLRRGRASKRRMASNPTSNSASRRKSSDRISKHPVKGIPSQPVMGGIGKSSFSAAEKVFPKGTGNNFGGEASSRCGLDR
jgi:hypothetical protein